MLPNILAYLCLNYPNKGDLSNARLTKMVYLADWFSSLIYNRQLTKISWVFNHYGPYVDDVIRIVNSQPSFEISTISNYFGAPKTIISYVGNANNATLTPETMSILTLVIDKTSSLSFDDFIQYIYSTYPIRASQRYATLNLPRLAREFEKTLQQ